MKVRCLLVLPLTSALLGCAAGVPGGHITIATITSSNLFGGEALFSGKLFKRNGCLVAEADDSFATPIFDPGVTLASDGKTIRDGGLGVGVPLGRPFRAGAAWLRGDGQGWSIPDIETFFGTRLPPGCPTENVIRLHDFELTGEGEAMPGIGD